MVTDFATDKNVGRYAGEDDEEDFQFWAKLVTLETGRKMDFLGFAQLPSLTKCDARA